MVNPNNQFIDEIKFKLGHQEWELQRLAIQLQQANAEIERLKNEQSAASAGQPPSE